jgi:hypothetical protein
MAHECPECGMWCHCGGDIDDCGHNFEEYQNACTHCPPDGIDRDDPYEDYESSIDEETGDAEGVQP